MYRMYYIGLILSLTLVMSSCDKEDTPTSQDPTDLIVEIINIDDGSGRVEILAKANNTIEYQFKPGDNTSTDPLTNATGIFSYKYQTSGIYLLEVRAYGESGRYLKNETQITVEVDGGTVDPEDGYSTPLNYDGMTRIWEDEFNGNTLNASDWTYEIGTGSNGWGNNELQYYRAENTTVGDGLLTIEAKKENFEGRSYTSSRLVTKDKVAFKYGRVDIRAKLPKGKGLWPALWMLGANIDDVGWPRCGETDIMEMVGGPTSDNTSHGTIHWDNNGQYAKYGDSYTLLTGIFNDKFHVFTIKWSSSTIIWYVDDNEFLRADITPTGLSEFHQDNFFIFNVAVGGNWPGRPDASTVFPQQMIVDYIRVFQED
jgi:hypothetical protein